MVISFKSNYLQSLSRRDVYKLVIIDCFIKSLDCLARKSRFTSDIYIVAGGVVSPLKVRNWYAV